MSIAFAGFEEYGGPGRRTTFLGTTGDDRLDGGFSLAIMGAGNDHVSSGPRGVVRAGPGDDDVDLVDGGTVHGGAGNDRLSLGFQETSWPDGETTFDGGAGDDRFGIESFYGSGRVWDPDAVDAHFAGGRGTDVIDLKGLRFGVRADLGARVARWKDGRFAWSDVEVFDGSARADLIRGSRGPDVVAADGGPDVVFGLSGDDRLTGGPGNDVVWGGPGRDVCRAERARLCEAE
jgi:Ca2+-binding RTX toxin-like protein